MCEQFNIFGNLCNPISNRKSKNNEKRNWENAFQRWSDAEAQDGTTSYGKCGYGSMCDYCENNTYGRPCVRALNEMCRKEELSINYSKRNFNEIWGGLFE